MELFSNNRWSFITGLVLDRLFSNCPTMYKDFKKHSHSHYSNLFDKSSMMLSLLQLLKSSLVQPILCYAGCTLQHVTTSTANIFSINLSLVWHAKCGVILFFNLLMFCIYNVGLFISKRWGFITGLVLNRLCLSCPMMYKDFNKHLWSHYSNMSDTGSMI
jgi:hypothetical protein